ncbi:MAG: hypothetical protein JXK93_04805 [Sphaerochaetaceae bacterium]|nr:hypothetical protein [Sphaerochaetaceae bacterium]
MISYRYRLTLFLLLMVLSAVSGAEYRFISYTMDSGLSNNSVFCMTQDRYGYMWIGTFGGLNRYDGTEYTVYKPDPANRSGLTSSVIFDVYEDSEGQIWVGTDGGGLHLYDRESDSFSSFRFDSKDPHSISSNQVFTILEDSSGVLWVGTGGGGLNRMTEEGTFISYATDPSSRDALHSSIIRKIIQDTSGIVWLATDGGGLARYNPDADTFTSFVHRRSLPDGTSVSGDSIKSLFEDSEGTLWVGFEDAGLAQFNPITREFLTVPLTDNPYESLSVRSVNEDDQGRLWIGTDGDGLFLITEVNTERQKVTHIEHQDHVRTGLNSDRVRSIFIDATGLVWIGMRDGGINLFNPLSLSFSRITKSGDVPYALSNSQIRELVETEDHMIWAATDSGLIHRIEPDTMEVSIPLDLSGVTEDSSYALFSDGEFLWVGTDGSGLYKYHIGTDQIIRQYTNQDSSGLKSNVVWDIFRDSKGTLWVGTENGGLHAYDPSSDTFKSYQFETDNPHSILGNSVREIYEDSFQNLWIGTWDGGLNRFISEERGFERFSFVPGDTSSLHDNSVNTIFEDSQRVLWVGTTGGGLNRFERENRTFTSYGTRQGFSDDHILGILEDDNGYLWLSTNNGLVRFHPETGDVVSFWEEDGLAGNEFSHKAYLRASDGRFYFGSSKGITSFLPQKISPRSIESPFLLTGLTLQNEKITVGPLILENSLESRLFLNRPLYEGPVVSLEPTDRFITFTFALLDYVNPSKNLYRVKLEGLNENWTRLGTQNSITFATIPPGTYDLKIRGTHYNGIPHRTELSVTIHVDSYFYQKWYFLLSVSVTLLLTIFFLFRLRIRKLEMKNQQLKTYALSIQEAREKKGKAIAREIHDQLGQILTILKFDLFRIARELKKGSDPDLAARADAAIETVDTAIESVRTISTRLRPSALDSLSFSEAIQWQFTEFSRRTGIEVTLDIANNTHPISEEKSVMMYRIVQEILTNVIRHAQATKVYCRFHENDQGYYLLITDDGVGCTHQELNSPTAFGIISIRERCESLGGTVTIQSERMRWKTPSTKRKSSHEQVVVGKQDNPGTRIEILIPLDKEG